jgi:predicted RNase H-like nuclease
MRVAGADGCRGGWIVATLDAEHHTTRPHAAEIAFVPRLDDTVQALRQGRLAVLGIDMPIGLPDRTPRASDAALRARLGPRRSSVFPTPARAVLAAHDFAEALAANRAALGTGLSIQAWNLVAKMREIDGLLGPEDQPAAVEVHPESSFAEMNSSPLATRKTTPAGRAERRGLLAAHLDGLADARGTAARKLPEVDVLDAAAAAWTAWRVACGAAVWIGDPAARDRRGLAMLVAV